MWKNERCPQKRGGPAGGRGHVRTGSRKDAAPVSAAEGIQLTRFAFQFQRAPWGAWEGGAEMEEAVVVWAQLEPDAFCKVGSLTPMMPGKRPASITCWLGLVSACDSAPPALSCILSLSWVITKITVISRGDPKRFTNMSLLNPHQVCEIRCSDCSHFTDEKTEAVRGVSAGHRASKLQEWEFGTR